MQAEPRKSQGLNWPFLHFPGGLLWMQRGIPAMARSGGNTVFHRLAFLIASIRLFYYTPPLKKRTWPEASRLLFSLWREDFVVLSWKNFTAPSRASLSLEKFAWSHQFCHSCHEHAWVTHEKIETTHHYLREHCSAMLSRLDRSDEVFSSQLIWPSSLLCSQF